eukprot:9104754-Karenia_brevis.AAC.1
MFQCLYGNSYEMNTQAVTISQEQSTIFSFNKKWAHPGCDQMFLRPASMVAPDYLQDLYEFITDDNDD